MLHMCINFRVLNNQTKIGVCPVPHIDEIFDCLYKARLFSKINLSKAYCQVAIAPSHTHKTAFLKQYRLFEFLVLHLDWSMH